MYEQGLDQTRPVKWSQVTLAHLHKFLSSESSGFWHSDLNSLVWLDAARFDSRPTWKFFFSTTTVDQSSRSVIARKKLAYGLWFYDTQITAFEFASRDRSVTL
jgi:hypothetical protein